MSKFFKSRTAKQLRYDGAAWPMNIKRLRTFYPSHQANNFSIVFVFGAEAGGSYVWEYENQEERDKDLERLHGLFVLPLQD